jgi:hypothetical protein
MINENFVFLGVLLNIIGSGSYLIDTIRGRVKPNKVTWLLWALAPLVAFAAQITQGVGISSLMTFSVGFLPLLIFLASFVNKKSQWAITRFDLICGAFSFIGIILWYITRVGNIAIFFSIIADALAALPTIIKAYKEPETESAFAFLMASIGTFITLLTIPTWDFTHFGFLFYILVVNMSLYVLIQFKIGKRFTFNNRK